VGGESATGQRFGGLGPESDLRLLGTRCLALLETFSKELPWFAGLFAMLSIEDLRRTFGDVLAEYRSPRVPAGLAPDALPRLTEEELLFLQFTRPVGVTESAGDTPAKLVEPTEPTAPAAAPHHLGTFIDVLPLYARGFSFCDLYLVTSGMRQRPSNPLDAAYSSILSTSIPFRICLAHRAPCFLPLCVSSFLDKPHIPVSVWASNPALHELLSPQPRMCVLRPHLLLENLTVSTLMTQTICEPLALIRLAQGGGFNAIFDFLLRFLLVTATKFTPLLKPLPRDGLAGRAHRAGEADFWLVLPQQSRGSVTSAPAAGRLDTSKLARACVSREECLALFSDIPHSPNSVTSILQHPATPCEGWDAAALGLLAIAAVASNSYPREPCHAAYCLNGGTNMPFDILRFLSFYSKALPTFRVKSGDHVMYADPYTGSLSKMLLLLFRLFLPYVTQFAFLGNLRPSVSYDRLERVGRGVAAWRAFFSSEDFMLLPGNARSTAAERASTVRLFVNLCAAYVLGHGLPTALAVESYRGGGDVWYAQRPELDSQAFTGPRDLFASLAGQSARRGRFLSDIYARDIVGDHVPGSRQPAPSAPSVYGLDWIFPPICAALGGNLVSNGGFTEAELMQPLLDMLAGQDISILSSDQRGREASSLPPAVQLQLSPEDVVYLLIRDAVRMHAFLHAAANGMFTRLGERISVIAIRLLELGSLDRSLCVAFSFAGIRIPLIYLSQLDVAERRRAFNSQPSPDHVLSTGGPTAAAEPIVRAEATAERNVSGDSAFSKVLWGIFRAFGVAEVLDSPQFASLPISATPMEDPGPGRHDQLPADLQPHLEGGAHPEAETGAFPSLLTSVFALLCQIAFIDCFSVQGDTPFVRSHVGATLLQFDLGSGNPAEFFSFQNLIPEALMREVLDGSYHIARSQLYSEGVISLVDEAWDVIEPLFYPYSFQKIAEAFAREPRMGWSGSGGPGRRTLLSCLVDGPLCGLPSVRRAWPLLVALMADVRFLRLCKAVLKLFLLGNASLFCPLAFLRFPLAVLRILKDQGCNPANIVVEAWQGGILTSFFSGTLEAGRACVSKLRKEPLGAMVVAEIESLLQTPDNEFLLPEIASLIRGFLAPPDASTKAPSGKAKLRALLQGRLRGTSAGRGTLLLTEERVAAPPPAPEDQAIGRPEMLCSICRAPIPGDPPVPYYKAVISRTSLLWFVLGHNRRVTHEAPSSYSILASYTWPEVCAFQIDEVQEKIGQGPTLLGRGCSADEVGRALRHMMEFFQGKDVRHAVGVFLSGHRTWRCADGDQSLRDQIFAPTLMWPRLVIMRNQCVPPPRDPGAGLPYEIRRRDVFDDFHTPHAGDFLSDLLNTQLLSLRLCTHQACRDCGARGEDEPCQICSRASTFVLPDIRMALDRHISPLSPNSLPPTEADIEWIRVIALRLKDIFLNEYTYARPLQFWKPFATPVQTLCFLDHPEEFYRVAIFFVDVAMSTLLVCAALPCFSEISEQCSASSVFLSSVVGRMLEACRAAALLVSIARGLFRTGVYMFLQHETNGEPEARAAVLRQVWDSVLSEEQSEESFLSPDQTLLCRFGRTLLLESPELSEMLDGIVAGLLNFVDAELPPVPIDIVVAMLNLTNTLSTAPDQEDDICNHYTRFFSRLVERIIHGLPVCKISAICEAHRLILAGEDPDTSALVAGEQVITFRPLFNSSVFPPTFFARLKERAEDRYCSHCHRKPSDPRLGHLHRVACPICGDTFCLREVLDWADSQRKSKLVSFRNTIVHYPGIQDASTLCSPTFSFWRAVVASLDQAESSLLFGANNSVSAVATPCRCGSLLAYDLTADIFVATQCGARLAIHGPYQTLSGEIDLCHSQGSEARFHPEMLALCALHLIDRTAAILSQFYGPSEDVLLALSNKFASSELFLLSHSIRHDPWILAYRPRLPADADDVSEDEALEAELRGSYMLRIFQTLESGTLPPVPPLRQWAYELADGLDITADDSSSTTTELASGQIEARAQSLQSEPNRGADPYLGFYLNASILSDMDFSSGDNTIT